MSKMKQVADTACELGFSLEQVDENPRLFALLAWMTFNGHIKFYG